MRPLLRSSFAASFLFAVVAGCQCGAPIAVTSISAEGELEDVPKWVRIQLDTPLFDATQPLAKPPTAKVTLKPSVPTTVRFPTPFSVDVEFAAPLNPATEYTLTVSGLASVDGKAQVKSAIKTTFRTPRNRLERISTSGDGYEGTSVSYVDGQWQGDLGTLGPNESIQLGFRFPVTKAAIEKLVHVFVQDGQEVAWKRFEVSPEPGTDVTLTPASPWTPNTSLKLLLDKGLPTVAGPLVTEAQQTYDMATFGPLRVVGGPVPFSAGCDGGKTIELQFNNPVSCPSFVEGLRISTNGSLKCVTQTAARKVRVEPVPLPAPETRVEVTIPVGITDVFGQSLAEGRTFEFQRCSGNEAQFAYQKPFVILDPQLPPEHVERVWNASGVKVEGKKLDLATLWKVIGTQQLGDQVAWTELPWWLSDSGYEDWYEGDTRKPGEPKTPEIPELSGASSVTVPVEAGADKWSDVTVGLEQFVTGGRGLALLRVTPLAMDKTPTASYLRVVNLTDLGLTVRASRESMTVLVARYSNGKPVAEAELAVMNKDGTYLGKAVTDASGLATIRIDQLSANPGSMRSDDLLVAAKKDNDESFVWTKFVSDSNYDDDEAARPVGLAFADRGIYKPGETAHFKAIARLATKDGFGSLAGTATVLRVVNPDDEEVLSKDVTLSEYGTADGEWAIPKDAKLGWYRVVLRIAGNDWAVSGGFTVGEFRRAEMKVEVQAPATIANGETLRATIQADYLFGAPAGGLKVDWSVVRTVDAYRSQKFPDAEFRDPRLREWGWSDATGARVLSDGSGTLDSNGDFPVIQPLKLPAPVGQLEKITVSGTVEDANGQSVSRSREVSLFGTSVLVGLQAERYMFEAKKPVTVTLVTLNPDDTPAANVPVQLRTEQVSWRYTRREGPGGGLYWTSERVVESDVERCSGQSDASGTYKCTFTPTLGGSLQLVAVAKDAKNREARAGDWHWVYGDPDYWGSGDGGAQVDLRFEKDKLDSGQPMKVSVTSPYREGVLLLTVEREDVLWSKSLEIGSNATVEIPTLEAWAPNVHVVATIVRGRLETPKDQTPDPDREKPAYAIGRRSVEVRPVRAVVEPKVTVTKLQLEPGQQQTAAVEVKDAAGQPVADAEVTLWAVDEGVLMLTGYATPNPIEQLFSWRGSRTLGLDTRGYVLGKRVFIEPIIQKGEEEGGGGGDENDARLRKNFDPLAVWVGAATTDASGRISKDFTVPDTLTTYRVMAVVVTKDDRFGRADTQFKVNKQLMLRQALARFVRPGDTFKAGVLVNHLKDAPQKVVVSVESIDETLFKVSGERTREVEVAPNSTVPVLFDVAANDVEGAAQVRFAAKMGDNADRVELELPVKRLTPRETVAIGGVVTNASFTGELKVPEGARAQSLTVSLSAVPFAGLESRLRDIVQYPYGCLEQRTSRVLPLIAVKRIADDLKFTSLKSDDIAKWVEEWVGYVPKYRCDDGGFDYYPGCRWGSSQHLTSFALEGLLTAKKYGYPVPEGEIRKTVDYLQRNLREGRDNRGQEGTEASALRVLAEAGAAEPAIEQAVYERRAGFPLFAKVDLVRAIAFRLGAAARKDATVQALLSEISGSAKESGGAITFPAVDPDRYWWAWDSSQRNTAMVLRALTQVVPDDARIPLIARGLSNLDDASEYYVTQDTTQTLLALAEALPILKPGKDAPKVTVILGGETLATGKTIGLPLETLALDPAKTVGAVPVRIDSAGPSNTYFGGALTYAYPAPMRLPAASHGFTITRAWSDQDGKALVPVVEDGKKVLKVAAGTYVRVDVVVQVADDGRLVAIEDPLPAGFEPVDANLATSNQEMLRRLNAKRPEWWDSYYKELRDDRVQWHYERIWKGELKLSYVAKAITPGRFHAPGTRAERLYQPQVNGRAEAVDVIVVKP